MSRHRALLIVLVSLLLPRIGACADAGSIVGRLGDASGQRTFAGEAAVILCDARTGYPIDRVTRKPIERPGDADPAERWWIALTGDDGAFGFKDVPPGRYRLVAQSWSGTRGMPKMPGNTSTFLILHGVVDNVEVKAGERADALLRQPGAGVLRLTTDPAEEHAYLFIGLKPTVGDPILGPYGWGEAFIASAIGFTHMEQPHVTIIGLPDDRDIHVALLNYDNNPGFGAGTFKPGQRQGTIRIVASWSNGHKQPPPELAKLTDHLEKNKLALKDFVAGAASGQDATQKALALLREDPHREVDVPGLGRHRLIDVLAALRYVALRAGR